MEQLDVGLIGAFLGYLEENRQKKHLVGCPVEKQKWANVLNRYGDIRGDAALLANVRRTNRLTM